MKKLILSLAVLFCFSSAFLPKKWSDEQWKTAGTTESAELSQEEKEIIRYVNLVRLYPKDFADIEVAPYMGIPERDYDLSRSPYKKSLLKLLRTMSPVKALKGDSLLMKDARCFARETGKNGLKGHDRKDCPELRASECISYARNNGREVVLQLLVDHNVKSLGHRKICLDPHYTLIGCAMEKHAKYDDCAVLQFK